MSEDTYLGDTPVDLDAFETQCPQPLYSELARTMPVPQRRRHGVPHADGGRHRRAQAARGPQRWRIDGIGSAADPAQHRRARAHQVSATARSALRAETRRHVRAGGPRAGRRAHRRLHRRRAGRVVRGLLRSAAVTGLSRDPRTAPERRRVPPGVQGGGDPPAWDHARSRACVPARKGAGDVCVPQRGARPTGSGSPIPATIWSRGSSRRRCRAIA